MNKRKHRSKDGTQKNENDIYNYETRLEDALMLIKKSKRFCKADKRKINSFLDHLASQNVSVGRLSKYAFHLKTICEELKTPLESAQRKDIEKLMATLNKRNYSPATVSNFGMIIKRFFKFVRYGNVDRETPFPEEVRWMT